MSNLDPITRGNTETLSFAALTAGGAPLDLTGLDLTWTATDGTTTLTKRSADGGIVPNVPLALGTGLIKFSAADTATWPASVAVVGWYLNAADPVAGTVYTIDSGLLEIRALLARLSYASPADLKARISPQILTQLSAKAGATAPDDSVIQSWLNAASETINGWIATRYLTPVDPASAPAATYAQLVNWEADIAAYNGYTYRGVEDGQNPWKARHDAITSKNEGILMRVAAGTMNLPGCALQAIPSNLRSPVRAGFTSERAHFNPLPLYGGGGYPFGED